MNEHVQTATNAPLFDPLSPEFIRNPYPYYERLRTTDPMHLTPLGAFVASRHAEVSLVLRDKRFGKEHVERTIRRYFEPTLATLMAKDQQAAAKRNEVGLLDFDPFLDAQDWDVTAFDIVVSDAAVGKAKATVKFVNEGQARAIVLDLVQVKNAWRIYDVTWQRDGKAETLRSIFVH